VTGSRFDKSDTTPACGVLRVDKNAGRWEAVPRDLMSDSRLGWDTRGFAAWLLFMPEGWQIRVGALPHLLRNKSCAIGRETVRRFLRELSAAGYLVRSRRRLPSGVWFWESLFSPIAVKATMGGLATGGSTTDGSAVGGQAVDTTKTLSHSRLHKSIPNETTTQPASGPSVVVADLKIEYPECLRGTRLAAARALIAACPQADRQAVLDEIAAMHAQNRVRSPLGLLRRLVEAACAGIFAPNISLREPRTGAGETAPGPSRVSSRGSQPETAGEIAARALSHVRLRPK
jgi:hypothetical protein